VAGVGCWVWVGGVYVYYVDVVILDYIYFILFSILIVICFVLSGFCLGAVVRAIWAVRFIVTDLLLCCLYLLMLICV